MSCAFTITMLLLSSSVATAYILQPSKEQRATSANSLVSYQRCRDESLQSARKALLRGLSLQDEPQLPAGGLDNARELWKSMFSAISHKVKYTAVPVVPGLSASPDDVGNSTSLKCCSMASEIFMKDLGWDNWVIHPPSLTVVQCVLCNPEVNTVQCSSRHHNIHDADYRVQMPCCQPTTEEMVPFLYMDDLGTLVITSAHLTRTCGCDAGDIQQLGEE